jgi:hypothetical protein
MKHGLLTVLQEMSGGGHILQVDTFGGPKLNLGGSDSKHLEHSANKPGNHSTEYRQRVQTYEGATQQLDKVRGSERVPTRVPWEDAEEKKKKQGTNNAHLAYVFQVYQPDYKRIKNLCQITKQRKLWLQHWSNAAFTVKIPENNSQQGEKTRYIQMVQTHGLVQLSLGVASINGVIDADLDFTLQLMLDVDGNPRAPTTTSLREIFQMMEVEGRKVWICMARGSNGNYTGYFSSVVMLISTHVTNFVACPGAQVYWWLR